MKDKKHCPICPVTVLLAFASYIATGYMVHGYLMQDIYSITSELWATPDVINHNMPFYYVGAFVFSVCAAIVFQKGYEGKGVDEGIRFGILFGTALAALKISTYPFGLVPMPIIAAWGIGDIFQMFIMGLVLAICYSKKCKTAICSTGECDSGMCDTEEKPASKKKSSAKKIK
jgi:hypothetical protein